MPKIDRLRNMKEAELREYVLQPLLKSMKFQDVSLNHGSHEKGKDIICWRRDELGCRRNLALVVKAVRLTGQAKVTKGALSEVSTQVQQCFCNTFIDHAPFLQAVCCLYHYSSLEVSSTRTYAPFFHSRRAGRLGNY